jgi:hypothetical protein
MYVCIAKFLCYSLLLSTIRILRSHRTFIVSYLYCHSNVYSFCSRNVLWKCSIEVFPLGFFFFMLVMFVLSLIS